jgi:hypothetical protein
MNVLDENFPDDEWQLLERQRIRVHKIGRGIGRQGMDDDEIVPLLHELHRPTFFTQDADFFHRRLCHGAYCLVHLDVDKDLLADYVRRVLRHRDLNTKAKRLGCVIQVRPKGISLWRIARQNQVHVEWA